MRIERGNSKFILAWTALFCLLQAALFNAYASEGDAARTSVGVPEEVLVLGEQPGPGLWKVTKGAHTLWILGTYVPTPQGMVWRSKQVEATIAASNEVLGPYSASLRVKDDEPYQSRRATLRDALPRRVYARWLTLRDKFIGEDPETEKLLPTAAALLLRARAYERIGLSHADDVWRDMPALQTLVEADASYAESLAHSWPFLGPEEVARLQLEAENKLLSALERALNRNETTLVVLPIHLVSRSNGIVSNLRAAGYHVQEPS